MRWRASRKRSIELCVRTLEALSTSRARDSTAVAFYKIELVGGFPTNFQAPFQIPDNWSYGHSDYLKVDALPAPMLPIPTDVPPNGSAKPAGDARAW